MDRGPLGGTCLNRGCIPSQAMLYPADVIRTIEDARAIGVHAKVEAIDFDLIMERVWQIALEGRHEMEQGVAHSSQIEFFQEEATFVGERTLGVGRAKIKGERTVIASGARPLVPPIGGLERTGYRTSANLFDLKSPPESLVTVGGGYVAAEFAHFFSAIGARVTVVGRNARLLPQEEPEISALLKERLSRHCEVHTGYEAVRAYSEDGLKVVVAENKTDGQRLALSAQEILVAAGRRSNADILQPARTGVETDSRGWIVVDPFLRTTNDAIWAFGDALGKHMFRHNANYRAAVVWRNAFTEHQHPIDEHAIPHAVFTYPQIAAVGMTEAQASTEYDVLVGVKRYADTAKGWAIGEVVWGSG